LGVFLAAAAYAVSPPFLAWLSPVVIGLLLSIPVSAAVGRQDLGQAARRLGLLVTPEETVPPPILQRANELSHELTEKHRRRTVDVFERLVRDPDLYDLHMTMVFPQPKRRKGEFDADLLMGLAKLSDVDSLKEASELLSNREKLMVLHDWAGLNRLRELVNA
jgi:membrane glycosyltransferase